MAFVRTLDGNYLCESGDEFLLKGIRTGTILTEVDTGKRYVFYNGAWSEDLTMVYAIKEAMSE